MGISKKQILAVLVAWQNLKNDYVNIWEDDLDKIKEDLDGKVI